MKSLISQSKPEAGVASQSGSSQTKSQTASTITVKRCLLAIGVFWIASLVLLFALQLLHTGMGLKIWPMGEDRIWLAMLQNNHGAGIARAFWQINDRNPLSPWWYIAVAPIVLGHDFGIYFVRKIVDPLLALATFFLLDQIGEGRQRPFALTCATLVLFWNFCIYYNEQIMWNFLMALCLTLSSIWSYCKFVDSGRSKATYMSLSLVLYFAAFTSYTIQCGALVANFLLACLRSGAGSSRWLRVKAALSDGAMFLSLFGLYFLTWVTTSRPASDYYALHTRLFKKQFLPSVQSLIWHDDYTRLLAKLATDWSPLVLAVSGAAVFGICYLLLQKLWQRETIKATRSFFFSLLSILLAVSLPTVLLEAMSNVWYPGTRVRMVGQFVSPCLFVGAIYALSAWLAKWQNRWGRLFLLLALALLASAALLMGLEYNKQLCAQSAFERTLVTELRQYAGAKTADQYFLIRLDNCDWFMSAALDDTFLQTALGRQNVHMRLLPKPPALPGFESNWLIEIGDKGVKHAAFSSGGEWVPWPEIVLVSYDGHRVRLINPVTPADVRGYQVIFQSPLKIRQQSASQGRQ